MKVGINFISTIPRQIIKDLFNRNIIQALKFPAISCNEQEMNLFLQAIQNMNVETDIHGIIGLNSSWNSKSMLKNVNAKESIQLFQTNCNKRFSSHIGRFSDDGDAMENFYHNLEKMRKLLPSIRLGGENVFSFLSSEGTPQYMAKECSSPEFINKMWDNLDFAVLDIPHAMVAARDCKMKFAEYISALNKEKVEIIHFSARPLSDETDDWHTPAGEEDFQNLQKVLSLCPNCDIVISEIAYSLENGERVLLQIGDYIREAQRLHEAIKDL